MAKKKAIGRLIFLLHLYWHSGSVLWVRSSWETQNGRYSSPVVKSVGE